MVAHKRKTHRAEQVSEMQKEIKSMADVIARLAVQTSRLDSLSERFNTLDARIEEMRHGRGYVERDNRKGLSGEY
jgi:cell division protein FtsB